MSDVSIISLSAGELGLGNGLLTLIRPALNRLPVGGAISLVTSNKNNRYDLPRWCQVEKHEYVRCEETEAGDVHFINRGIYPKTGRPQVNTHGPVSSWSQLIVDLPFPKTANSNTGFAPRGAAVEVGGNTYPFSLKDRDFIGSPEVGELYDQAVKNQWNAERDVPWETIKPLSPQMDWAINQLMTFLAENELSALYLPSRFVSQIHPFFMESSMFLATQMMDETRHIDVFLRRAWASGSTLGMASVVTSSSLLSLLNCRDFIEASFLLSVLGEGTFLDLLSFIEKYAPDKATEVLVNRARQDESRHVHFGISHISHALKARPELKRHLENSVQRRADDLASVTGAPPALQDALVLLAAGSTNSQDIKRGHRAYRELLETMEKNRIKRLIKTGFSEPEAGTLSALHTPNFM